MLFHKKLFCCTPSSFLFLSLVTPHTCSVVQAHLAALRRLYNTACFHLPLLAMGLQRYMLSSRLVLIMTTGSSMTDRQT